MVRGEQVVLLVGLDLAELEGPLGPHALDLLDHRPSRAVEQKAHAVHRGALQVHQALGGVLGGRRDLVDAGHALPEGHRAVELEHVLACAAEVDGARLGGAAGEP